MAEITLRTLRTPDGASVRSIKKARNKLFLKVPCAHACRAFQRNFNFLKKVDKTLPSNTQEGAWSEVYP